MGVLFAILLSASSPAPCSTPHDGTNEIVHVEVVLGEEADFGPWLCAFERELYRNWPASGSAGTRIRTARLSAVHSRGGHAWVRVMRSTDVAALDAQVQRAVEITEFPPYPAGYYDDQLRLQIEVRYRTEDKPSACFATQVPSGLGDALRVPADTQMTLDHYRNGWRDLCHGAPGHPTLEALLAEAETLDRLPFDDGGDLASFVDLALPGMMMGIDLAPLPDHAAFAEAAERFGSDDDRLFWSLYSRLNPYFPAWIRGTWDYGGCPLFGEYDWVAGFEALQTLLSEVRGTKYRELAQVLDGFFWLETVELGDGEYPLCTCGATAAVLPDLERLAKALNAVPSLARKAAQLHARIEEIKSGRLKVTSEREGRCSGG